MTLRSAVLVGIDLVLEMSAKSVRERIEGDVMTPLRVNMGKGDDSKIGAEDPTK